MGATAQVPSLVPDGVGERIKMFRRASEMTQADLASLVGRSVPWLGAVEQGRTFVDRLSDLLSIARAVGVSLDDLIGRPVDSIAPGAPGGVPHTQALDAVRTAVMGTAVPISRTEPAPPPLIDERVSELWSLWHNSPNAHASVGRLLPTLITDAVVTSALTPGRPAYASLAGAYAITRQWLHHVTPEAPLTWVVAERTMTAARMADDPLLVALAAWALSASYRRVGQQEESTRLCLAAADELRPLLDAHADDPRYRAAYGMLHLAGSISSAQSLDDGKAWQMHGIADGVAETLAGYEDPWTKFGPGNIAIHAMAINAELGNAEAVIELGRAIDTSGVSSVERRSAAMIDLGRAFLTRGDDEAAVHALIDGEQISADRIRNSPIVHEMLRSMLARDRASARQHVRGLATRCRLIHV